MQLMHMHVISPKNSRDHGLMEAGVDFVSTNTSFLIGCYELHISHHIIFFFRVIEFMPSYIRITQDRILFVVAYKYICMYT